MCVDSPFSFLCMWEGEASPSLPETDEGQTMSQPVLRREVCKVCRQRCVGQKRCVKVCAKVQCKVRGKKWQKDQVGREGGRLR